MRTLLLALSMAVSTSACQTLSRQPDLGESAYRKSDYRAQRSPAALKCDIEYVDAEILKTIPADPGIQTQVAQIREYLANNGQLRKIVPMSDAMLEFRKQYLPFLKIDAGYREGIVRWMEGGLRLKSSLTEKLLADPLAYTGRARAQYDFVVVGSGVHGTLAVAELLQKNPNYRILVVEASDTVAANFRYAGDTFSINSSNRASGNGSIPLPGQGNINELPGLPIQVSDISAVKYPSANDLGSSLVAGLYASVSRYKNVDVVFSTELQSATKKLLSFDGDAIEGFEIIAKKEGLRKFPAISAKKMIVASGLGTPTLPPGVKRSVRQFPELVKSKFASTVLPRVMTFEDVMRVLAQSNNPRGFFAGKTVAVVGTGDSANVFIEFMLGYATPGAYGFSSAQIRGPQKVYWVGQKRATCEAYIADARSRYAQIGTGYRSSDPDAQPIIEAIDDRLDSVTPFSESQATLKLQNGTPSVNAEVIILATGFESQLRKILAGVVNESTGARNAVTDAEFLQRGFDYLSGSTSVSPTVTRVARTPKGSANGKLIIVGPGAGRLPQDEELVGIIQNTVSIFNNAPRTVSATRSITSGVTPLEEASRTAAIQLKLSGANTSRIVEIGGLSETRLISNATTPYLSSVLTSVLSKIELPSSYRGSEFSIGFKLAPGGVKIQLFSLADNVNLTPVAEALAETRDFFNLTYQVLVYNRNQGIYLKALVENGAIDLTSAKLSFDRAVPVNGTPVTPVIQNPSIVLRGIE